MLTQLLFCLLVMMMHRSYSEIHFVKTDCLGVLFLVHHKGARNVSLPLGDYIYKALLEHIRPDVASYAPYMLCIYLGPPTLPVFSQLCYTDDSTYFRVVPHNMCTVLLVDFGNIHCFVLDILGLCLHLCLAC